MPNIGQVYVTQNSTTRPRADDHLPSARRLRRCASRPCLVLPSGSAYSMSNETYLPPTFAIAWTPIRISGTSRMMAMGNRKTTARVGPSTTPRRCTSMRALTSKNLPTSPRARRRPSQPLQYRRQSRHSRQLATLRHVAF